MDVQNSSNAADRPRFNIPKIKKTTFKDNIQKVDIHARDVVSMFKDITKNCLDTNFIKKIDILEVSMVHNSELQARYVKKRAEMKESGRNVQTLIDQFGFRVTKFPEKLKFAKEGLVAKAQPYNGLGKSEFGVYLTRHFDIEVQKAWMNGVNTIDIFVFKYISGKCKLLNMGKSYNKFSSLEPTPNYDSHINSVAPTIDENFYAQIAKSNIYLYEYTEDCVASKFPRHCLPFAIISLKRKKLSEVNQTPIQRDIQTSSVANEVSESRPAANKLSSPSLTENDKVKTSPVAAPSLKPLVPAETVNKLTSLSLEGQQTTNDLQKAAEILRALQLSRGQNNFEQQKDTLESKLSPDNKVKFPIYPAGKNKLNEHIDFKNGYMKRIAMAREKIASDKNSKQAEFMTLLPSVPAEHTDLSVSTASNLSIETKLTAQKTCLRNSNLSSMAEQLKVNTSASNSGDKIDLKLIKSKVESILKNTFANTYAARLSHDPRVQKHHLDHPGDNNENKSQQYPKKYTFNGTSQKEIDPKWNDSYSSDDKSTSRHKRVQKWNNSYSSDDKSTSRHRVVTFDLTPAESSVQKPVKKKMSFSEYKQLKNKEQKLQLASNTSDSLRSEKQDVKTSESLVEEMNFSEKMCSSSQLSNSNLQSLINKTQNSILKVTSSSHTQNETHQQEDKLPESPVSVYDKHGHMPISKCDELLTKLNEFIKNEFFKTDLETPLPDTASKDHMSPSKDLAGTKTSKECSEGVIREINISPKFSNTVNETLTQENNRSLTNLINDFHETQPISIQRISQNSVADTCAARSLVNPETDELYEMMLRHDGEYESSLETSIHGLEELFLITENMKSNKSVGFKPQSETPSLQRQIPCLVSGSLTNTESVLVDGSNEYTIDNHENIESSSVSDCQHDSTGNLQESTCTGTFSEVTNEFSKPLPKSISMRDVGIRCYLLALGDMRYQPSTVLVDFMQVNHQNGCKLCKSSEQSISWHLDAITQEDVIADINLQNDATTRIEPRASELSSTIECVSAVFPGKEDSQLATAKISDLDNSYVTDDNCNPRDINILHVAASPADAECKVMQSHMQVSSTEATDELKVKQITATQGYSNAEKFPIRNESNDKNAEPKMHDSRRSNHATLTVFNDCLSPATNTQSFVNPKQRNANLSSYPAVLITKDPKENENILISGISNTPSTEAANNFSQKNISPAEVQNVQVCEKPFKDSTKAAEFDMLHLKQKCPHKAPYLVKPNPDAMRSHLSPAKPSVSQQINKELPEVELHVLTQTEALKDNNCTMVSGLNETASRNLIKSFSEFKRPIAVLNAFNPISMKLDTKCDKENNSMETSEVHVVSSTTEREFCKENNNRKSSEKAEVKGTELDNENSNRVHFFLDKVKENMVVKKSLDKEYFAFQKEIQNLDTAKEQNSESELLMNTTSQTCLNVNKKNGESSSTLQTQLAETANLSGEWRVPEDEANTIATPRLANQPAAENIPVIFTQNKRESFKPTTETTDITQPLAVTQPVMSNTVSTNSLHHFSTGAFVDCHMALKEVIPGTVEDMEIVSSPCRTDEVLFKPGVEATVTQGNTNFQHPLSDSTRSEPAVFYHNLPSQFDYTPQQCIFPSNITLNTYVSSEMCHVQQPVPLVSYFSPHDPQQQTYCQQYNVRTPNWGSGANFEQIHGPEIYNQGPVHHVSSLIPSQNSTILNYSGCSENFANYNAMNTTEVHYYTTHEQCTQNMNLNYVTHDSSFNVVNDQEGVNIACGQKSSYWPSHDNIVTGTSLGPGFSACVGQLPDVCYDTRSDCENKQTYAPVLRELPQSTEMNREKEIKAPATVDTGSVLSEVQTSLTVKNKEIYDDFQQFLSSTAKETNNNENKTPNQGTVEDYRDVDKIEISDPGTQQKLKSNTISIKDVQESTDTKEAESMHPLLDLSQSRDYLCEQDKLELAHLMSIHVSNAIKKATSNPQLTDKRYDCLKVLMMWKDALATKESEDLEIDEFSDKTNDEISNPIATTDNMHKSEMNKDPKLSSSCRDIGCKGLSDSLPDEKRCKQNAISSPGSDQNITMYSDAVVGFTKSESSEQKKINTFQAQSNITKESISSEHLLGNSTLAHREYSEDIFKVNKFLPRVLNITENARKTSKLISKRSNTRSREMLRHSTEPAAKISSLISQTSVNKSIQICEEKSSPCTKSDSGNCVDEKFKEIKDKFISVPSQKVPDLCNYSIGSSTNNSPSERKVYLSDVPLEVLSYARDKILSEINELNADDTFLESQVDSLATASTDQLADVNKEISKSNIFMQQDSLLKGEEHEELELGEIPNSPEEVDLLVNQNNSSVNTGLFRKREKIKFQLTQKKQVVKSQVGPEVARVKLIENEDRAIKLGTSGMLKAMASIDPEKMNANSKTVNSNMKNTQQTVYLKSLRPKFKDEVRISLDSDRRYSLYQNGEKEELFCKKVERILDNFPTKTTCTNEVDFVKSPLSKRNGNEVSRNSLRYKEDCASNNSEKFRSTDISNLGANSGSDSTISPTKALTASKTNGESKKSVVSSTGNDEQLQTAQKLSLPEENVTTSVFKRPVLLSEISQEGDNEIVIAMKKMEKEKPFENQCKAQERLIMAEKAKTEACTSAENQPEISFEQKEKTFENLCPTAEKVFVITEKAKSEECSSVVNQTEISMENKEKTIENQCQTPEKHILTVEEAKTDACLGAENQNEISFEQINSVIMLRSENEDASFGENQNKAVNGKDETSEKGPHDSVKLILSNGSSTSMVTIPDLEKQTSLDNNMNLKKTSLSCLISTSDSKFPQKTAIKHGSYSFEQSQNNSSLIVISTNMEKDCKNLSAMPEISNALKIAPSSLQQESPQCEKGKDLTSVVVQNHKPEQISALTLSKKAPVLLINRGTKSELIHEKLAAIKITMQSDKDISINKNVSKHSQLPKAYKDNASTIRHCGRDDKRASYAEWQTRSESLSPCHGVAKKRRIDCERSPCREIRKRRRSGSYSQRYNDRSRTRSPFSRSRRRYPSDSSDDSRSLSPFDRRSMYRRRYYSRSRSPLSSTDNSPYRRQRYLRSSSSPESWRKRVSPTRRSPIGQNRNTKYSDYRRLSSPESPLRERNNSSEKYCVMKSVQKTCPELEYYSSRNDSLQKKLSQASVLSKSNSEHPLDMFYSVCNLSSNAHTSTTDSHYEKTSTNIPETSNSTSNDYRQTAEQQSINESEEKETAQRVSRLITHRQETEPIERKLETNNQTKAHNYLMELQQYRNSQAPPIKQQKITTKQLIIYYLGISFFNNIQSDLPYSLDTLINGPQFSMRENRARALETIRRSLKHLESCNVPMVNSVEPVINDFGIPPVMRRLEEFSNEHILLELNILKQCQNTLELQQSQNALSVMMTLHAREQFKMLVSKQVSLLKVVYKARSQEMMNPNTVSSDMVSKFESELAKLTEQQKQLMNTCGVYEWNQVKSTKLRDLQQYEPGSYAGEPLPKELQVPIYGFSFITPQHAMSEKNAVDLKISLETAAEKIVELYDSTSYGREHFRVPEILLLKEETNQWYSRGNVFLVLSRPLPKKIFIRFLKLKYKIELVEQDPQKSDEEKVATYKQLVEERASLLKSYVGNVTSKRVNKMRTLYYQLLDCENYLRCVIGPVGLRMMPLFENYLQAVKWHYETLQSELKNPSSVDDLRQ